MDNKYGLGSSKVATAHHELHHKPKAISSSVCRYCNSENLIPCPTLNDHYCKECGEYQGDMPVGYSSGHSADY